jgi:DNA-damage-inducible protein D
MESGQLKILYVTLDDIRHVDENGLEYWLGRELYVVLGYPKWDKFVPVIERAKIACMNSGGSSENHFQTICSTDKTLNSVISGDDIKLTRYACYLIAVNGDPKKQEIAFAQAYFITQTRRFEVLEAKMEEYARLNSRDKLIITEKEFGDFAIARGVDGKGIGMIKSRGDQELFGGTNTKDMKASLGIPENKPLADFLPNITLKAKDLATAMTTENAKRKNLMGLVPIGREHVVNNQNVREALVKNGIYPESLPVAEDIKLIQKRHEKERKEIESSESNNNIGKLF